MRKEDIPAVQAIDLASFSLPWPASAYDYELTKNQRSVCLVAELHSDPPQVVGMIVVWLILDEAHIATIATHPDYRRQGIAQQLIQAGLVEAANQGAAQATLEVRAGNLGAQDLYRRFGFQVVGARPRYYRDNNEDAFIMTMDPLNLDGFR